MKPLFKAMQLAAAMAVFGIAQPAMAATDIMWWHAMSGELGRQVEKLAADFNASQSEYRIIPSYKGNYTETVTAAIFAFRSRSQPAKKPCSKEHHLHRHVPAVRLPGWMLSQGERLLSYATSSPRKTSLRCGARRKS